ncbi:MAG TPA: sulfatase-like hydrolase/transferase [Terracidiphilus sp.]|nr:sulfatase-like hydrolase/transferase [Terracidiphilus sp.]
MKTRPWLEGAGLAMFYLLPPLAEFLSPARRQFYHQLLPVTMLTRGMLIDLLLLGILGGIVFTLLDRTAARLHQILWLPIFFVAAWIAARNISTTMRDPILRGHLLQLAPYAPAVVLAILAALLLFLPRIYDYCVRITAVVLAAGGIAVLLVVLPKLVLACFSHTPQEQAGFTHPVTNPWRPGQTRIVWIVFDELSYRQAFEHPQPGIDLPAFSRLAAESITFSQLSPIGYETERILPSLISGQPIADVEGDAQGRMLLRHNNKAAWQHFDQDATIFGAARRQGWGTGVAGWYNPYCRILNTVLDRCYWTFGQSVAGELFTRLSSRQSAWENARDGLPLAARVEALWGHAPSNQALFDDYSSLLHAGESLIQDPDIRLAFIHMPVPHPPGLVRNPGGAHDFDYLGNLLLADRAMAQFLRSLAASPSAADTVLIVSSDHSWRVPLWRGVPGWNKDEERATDGGHFDQRPVLMVRFPRQPGANPRANPRANPANPGAVNIDRPQSEMIAHSLVLDLIEGNVRTPEEWIAALPAGVPAPSQAD